MRDLNKPYARYLHAGVGSQTHALQAGRQDYSPTGKMPIWAELSRRAMVACSKVNFTARTCRVPSNIATPVQPKVQNPISRVPSAQIVVQYVAKQIPLDPAEILTRMEVLAHPAQ